MPTNFYELPPHELLAEAKEAIGMSALVRASRVGDKALYAQMKDPYSEGKSIRPFFDRDRIFLHDLNTMGGERGEALAVAIADHIVAGIGRHTVPNAAAVPDAPTVRAECLDDYPELVRLHDLIEQGADLRAVEAQAEQVKREIDETVVAYRLSIEGEA